MDNKLLSLKNISKTYDGKNYVLTDINLEVGYGELVAIRGKSGSGKSTLMNIIGLLDRYSNGEYFFEGKAIDKYRNYDTIRGNKISFIFQSYNSFQVPTSNWIYRSRRLVTL